MVLVCRSGARAGKACEALQQSGLEGIDVLDGGIAAYQDAVGGVNRSGGRWAMDRQVRMTAGTLVLAGTLAGQLVHRRLGLIAGAIGAPASNIAGILTTLEAVSYTHLRAHETN